MCNTRTASAALGIALALVACDDGVGTMPGNRKQPSGPQFTVNSRPTDFANATPEARAKARRAAIDAILKRFPEAEREEAKRLFDDPRNLAFSSSSDPEIATQLGVLNAIREVEMNALLDKAEKDREAASDRRGRETAVLVALVPTLPSHLRAQVVRQVGDGGQPLLLLRESDATSVDLARGLRAAALSIERHGANPAKAVRVSLRAAPKQSGGDEGSQRLLDYVKASSLRNIPGVGSVRANFVLTHRPRAG